MTIQKIGLKHGDGSVNYDVALREDTERLIIPCRTEEDADELVDTLDRLGMDTQIVDGVAVGY